VEIFDVTACEEIIGYSFKDKMLLRQCFTHSSYANEHGEDDNELLEFFGDAIIQFVVTEYLVNHAHGDEGKLTVNRAELVSKEPLLNVVKKLDLAKYMLLGEGQKKTTKKDEKLFSSLYEAICAGLYRDGGMAVAKKFIMRTLLSEYGKVKKCKEKDKPLEKDAKSAFQEYVQKRKLGTITYQTLTWSGPAHLPEFRVAALLNGARLAEGKGKSKKEAEKVAAKKALALLKKQEGKRK
jgi:ribonuclease-3